MPLTQTSKLLTGQIVNVSEEDVVRASEEVREGRRPWAFLSTTLYIQLSHNYVKPVSIFFFFCTNQNVGIYKY